MFPTMDLQTTNEDALMPSQTELPLKIINVIISNDFENETNTEVDINTEENHVKSTANTKDESDETAKVAFQEDTEKEHHQDSLRDKIALLQEDSDDEEKVFTSNDMGPRNTNGNNERSSVNGQITNNTPQTNDEIDTLWAEAIKAQNEGSYKHAIRNFTAILEVSS